MKTTIVDTTTISTTFPESSRPAVRREHVVDTVLSLLDESAEIVLIEGADGIGKTTLLAQIAMRTAECGLNLFLRPLSSLAADPGYLMQDLANQAHWAVFGNLRDRGLATEAEFRSLMSALQTMAKQSVPVRNVVVVVDGLSEFDDVQQAIRDEIVWKVLPFGRPGFRFVISGGRHALPERLLSASQVRHFQVPLLSQHEAAELLGDLDLPAATTESLYRESRKLPGHLAIFRREIMHGKTPEQLLENVPRDLQGYISQEWAGVEVTGPAGILAGLIAFAQRSYTSQEVAAILGWDAERLFEMVRRMPPLTISESSSEVVYVTEAHRRHAAGVLASRKNEVLDLVIGHLSSGSSSASDTDIHNEEIVSYLRVGNRHPELIAATTGEFLTYRLDTTGSFLPVLRHANDGLSSAQEIRDSEEMFRLAIVCSTLLELDSRGTLKPEIEALVAIGDLDDAIALAQSAPIVEDRAASLAAIWGQAKDLDTEKADTLRFEVITLVEGLLNSGSTIASRRLMDLIDSTLEVSPELAYRLIEHGSRRDEAAGSEQDDPHSGRTQETYTQESKDGDNRSSGAHEFLRAATRFSSGKEAPEILGLVAGLSGEQQLFFMLRWLESGYSRDGAVAIAERCLDLIVETGHYVPTVNDFTHVATAVAFHAKLDAPRCSEMIRRIQDLSAAARGRASSSDTVRLDLQMARAEMGRPAGERKLALPAFRRLVGIVEYVMSLADRPTQAHCLALMYEALNVELGSEGGALKDLGVFEAQVLDQLRDAVGLVVDSTANQFELLEPVIHALARVRLDEAVGLAGKLNTQHRRELAYAEIARELAFARPNGEIAEPAFSVLGCIGREVLRYTETTRLLENLALDPRAVPADAAPAFKRRITEIREWSDPGRSALALSAGARILARVGEDAVARSVAEMAGQRVAQIAVPPVRVNVGYRAARMIADAAPDAARALVRRCEAISHDDPDHLPSIQSAASSLISLASRALGGLVARKSLPSDALRDIAGAIVMLSSANQRLVAHVHVAKACLRAQDPALAAQVIGQYVLPEIHRLDETDRFAWLACLIEVIPVLYVTHQDVASGLLAKMPASAQEEAIEGVCKYLFYGLLTDEPVSMRSPETVPLDYGAAVRIVNALSFSTHDSQLDHHLKRVTMAAVYGSDPAKLTHEQRADLANRIDELAKAKLPDENNIGHVGYTLVLNGYSAALRGANGQEWLRLAEATGEIPNKSDRVYVLATLVEAMPRRLKSRTELLRRAMDEVRDIGSVLDAVDRYEMIAQAARRVDSRIARECIEAAIGLCTGPSSEPLERQVRSILDLAHGVDPALAERLASRLDSDPARNADTAMTFGDYVGILKAREDLGRPKASNDVDSKPIEQVLELARLHLASLNSNRITPISRERAMPFVARAGAYSLRAVEEVYAWVIENSICRSSDESAFLAGAFRSCIVSSSVVRRVATILRAQDERSRKAAGHVLGAIGEYAGLPKSRDQVLNAVREFARSSVGSYVKIADRYFGPQELWLLRAILEEKPECRIEVITSPKHHQNEGLHEDLARHYRDFWRTSVADGPLPEVDIHVIGKRRTGLSPIHDRWILTHDAGLRFGTSVNAIGVSSVSEISDIDADRAAELVRVFDAFSTRQQRTADGDELSYLGFSLR